jgi:hypothetical protein
MSDETNTQPQGDPAPVTTAPAPPVPDWLPERLAQAERSAQTKLLSQYGVKTPEELSTRLKQLETLENEKLSETERTQKLIKELAPKAERAAHVESLLSSLVESQFNALPEVTRTAIDNVANGNPEERLKLMQVISAAGLSMTPPVAPKPPPANTAPPANAPPPSGTRTKWDEFKAITNPMQRQVFYQLNAQEIEASRPS